MFTSFAYDREIHAYRDDDSGDITQAPFDIESYQIPPGSDNFSESDYVEMADLFDDIIHKRIMDGLYYYLSFKGIQSGPVVDFIKFTDDIIKGKYPKLTRKIFNDLGVSNPTFGQFDQLEADLKDIGYDALTHPIDFLTAILGRDKLEKILKSAYNILKLDNALVQDTIYIIEDARKNKYMEIDDLNRLLKFSDRPDSFVKPTEMNGIYEDVFSRFKLQKAYEKYLIDIDLYSDYDTN